MRDLFASDECCHLVRVVGLGAGEKEREISESSEDLLFVSLDVFIVWKGSRV